MDEIRDFLNKNKNLVSFLLSATITAIPIFIPYIENNPKIWYTAGWFIWVFKSAVDQIEIVNLTWHRAILWISNGSVSWTMSAELSGNSTPKSLEAVYSNVLRLFPDAKPWANAGKEKIITLPIGGNIRLSITEVQTGIDDFEELFFVEVSDFIVPFRESKRSLDTLISLIENAIKPVVEPKNEKYVFKIKFGDTNPYFGLFVKRFKVPRNKLITFRLEFNEKVGVSDERIDVSANKLALVTHSLTSLQLLSHKYITLSTIDMTSS